MKPRRHEATKARRYSLLAVLALVWCLVFPAWAQVPAPELRTLHPAVDVTVRLDVTGAGGVWYVTPVLVAHRANLILDELKITLNVAGVDDATAEVVDSPYWLYERVDPWRSLPPGRVVSDGLAPLYVTLPLETDYPGWTITLLGSGPPVLAIDERGYWSRVVGLDPDTPGIWRDFVVEWAE